MLIWAALSHYSSYRYTLSSNKQATDLIRYSNFRSKSPALVPILQLTKRRFKTDVENALRLNLRGCGG